jgi:hypothetical protein
MAVKFPINLFGPALQAQPIPEAEPSAMRYGADSLTGQSVRRCVTGAIAFSAQIVRRDVTAGTSAQGKQFDGALLHQGSGAQWFREALRHPAVM